MPSLDPEADDSQDRAPSDDTSTDSSPRHDVQKPPRAKNLNRLSSALVVAAIGTGAGFSVFKSETVESKLEDWKKSISPDSLAQLVDARLASTSTQSTEAEPTLEDLKPWQGDLEALLNPLTESDQQRQEQISDLREDIEKTAHDIEKIRDSVQLNSPDPGLEDRLEEKVTSLAQRHEALRQEVGALADEQMQAALAQVREEMVSHVKEITQANREQIEALQNLWESERQVQIVNESRRLERARSLLRADSDFSRALGLHLAIDADPPKAAEMTRRFVSKTNPIDSPQAVETFLTLSVESDDPTMRALFSQTVFGDLNRRWHAFGLEFVSRLDFQGRHASWAQEIMRSILASEVIDDPDQFSAVIKVLQALEPAASSLPKSQELRQAFSRFFANYLGARVMGFPSGESSFPVDDFMTLNPQGRWPRISSITKERVMALSQFAISYGVSKEASQGAIKLGEAIKALKPRQTEAQDLVAKALAEMSDQDFGHQWSAWREYWDSRS